MNRMRITPLLAAALVAAACGSADPTAPAMGRVDPDVAFSRGAVPQPGDPGSADENLNLRVCIKTVPASGHAAGSAQPRIIVRDDRDGECPGGFELTELFGAG